MAVTKVDGSGATTVVPGQAIAAGNPNATWTAGATSGGPYSVSFPTSRFTATPMVCVMQVGLPGGTQRLICHATGVSSSGFDIYLYPGDGAAVTVTGGQVGLHWIAVESG